jgi:hypothetical protein
MSAFKSKNSQRRKGMKLGLLVPLAALLVPQLSAAQIPGIQTSEVVQAGTTWEEVVKNVSGSPIVTLHATFHCLTTNGVRITDENGSHDSLYQFSRDRDIPPGDSVVVRVSGNNYAQCSGGVDAVIFSDGHSEGRSEEIANIYVHRRGLQKGLEFAIPLLDAIATGQLTTQDAIAALDKRGSSVAIDMTRSGKDRGGETIIYDFVLSNLRRQSDFSTPPDFRRSRQPRVEDLAKAKNLPLEQALAVVLSNRYKEWLAALEGHTEPPAAN